MLPSLAGESKSYAERLFNFPDIGPFSGADAAKALQEPVKAIRVEFIGDALAEMVIQRLDANFFRVRFDRLTPSEKRYLRAMAQLGPGAHRSSDIADTLGIKITSLGPLRAKLIKKGMIYSPAHGDMAFTVPLFDEFMLRAMPEP